MTTKNQRLPYKIVDHEWYGMSDHPNLQLHFCCRRSCPPCWFCQWLKRCASSASRCPWPALGWWELLPGSPYQLWPDSSEEGRSTLRQSFLPNPKKDKALIPHLILQIVEVNNWLFVNTQCVFFLTCCCASWTTGLRAAWTALISSWVISDDELEFDARRPKFELEHIHLLNFFPQCARNGK